MSTSIATSEEHLPHYRVRPRFKQFSPLASQELTGRISQALAQADAPVKGQVLDGHYATLVLPAEEQHYWSPQLSLSFEDEEGGSWVRGLYGPRPAVWTMFVFIYFCIGVATVVISLIGLSNLYLGQSGGILWLVPLLLAVFCSLYLVAYLGQKAGHDQMVELHHFLEESTGAEFVEEGQG
ncbi:MAG: hypothetical protein AAF433_00025 [Bacteroidota bacterium]